MSINDKTSPLSGGSWLSPGWYPLTDEGGLGVAISERYYDGKNWGEIRKVSEEERAADLLEEEKNINGVDKSWADERLYPDQPETEIDL